MGRSIIPFLFLCLSLSGCSAPSNPPRDLSSSPEIYLSAWFVPFDSSRGLQSFTEHVSELDEINPVWYNLNPSYFTPGTTPFEENLFYNGPIVTLAKTNGVKILPTVQNWGGNNFDSTIISRIINDPSTRSRHVRELISLVLDNEYDGIDIDYESLPVTDLAAFSAFINELGTSLHENGKLLSIALHAKTHNEANWKGPGAQDWKVIACYADMLKIMVYDYHWIGFHAGPIAPLDWLRDVLEYAATIPQAKGKIIIGLPLYGYDWDPEGGAIALTYDDAIKLMSERQILNPTRDQVEHSSNYCSYFKHNVEPHFEYEILGDIHTVYFQDIQATRERLKVISEYGELVKGVAFWRLGGEGLGVWGEMRLKNSGL